MEDGDIAILHIFSKNVAKYALFEKLFGVSALFKYFCRIICDDMRHKLPHKWYNRDDVYTRKRQLDWLPLGHFKGGTTPRRGIP